MPESEGIAHPIVQISLSASQGFVFNSALILACFQPDYYFRGVKDTKIPRLDLPPQLAIHLMQRLLLSGILLWFSDQYKHW